MNILEFVNFSCFYKNKKQYITALDGIDLLVKQGDFVAIVGESGSGKSTLLKCILGLADYFDGELRIEGTPVDRFDIKKSNYGFVGQDFRLNPHLTVFENIAYPLRVLHAPNDEVIRRVEEIAGFMGIELLLPRKPKQISMGQAQRAAIARAVIKNPTLICFDEPFSNLDDKTAVQLRTLIRKIHLKFQSTILFVTHNMDEAFSLGDYVVVLENGKITEKGPRHELMEDPKSTLLRGYFGK